MIATEVGCPVFENSLADLLERGERPKLKTIRIGKRSMSYLAVEVGNPHVVIPVRAFPKDWQKVSERISTHRQFTGGVNVEFTKVVTSRKVEVKVFERGVGETKSSGTGASAVVSALNTLGKVSAKTTVHFSQPDATGERLVVSWKDKLQPIVVSGTVRRLFDIEALI